MEIIDRPSPNFDARRGGTQPSLIILHFTGGKSAEYALNILTDGTRENRVSAHYMIDEEGRVYRLVDEDKRAWHAGVSSWRDIEDVNSASIGIELSNRDRNPYTKEQLLALSELCDGIRRRHGIAAHNIIGHSDIAPERKNDPGYHFPWRDVAKDDIGVMPKVRLRDKFGARAAAKKPETLRALFNAAGYGAYGLEHLVSAFQQHYTPRVYTAPRKGEKPGQPSSAMVARLRAVARYANKHSN